jgi:hypothetical protein
VVLWWCCGGAGVLLVKKMKMLGITMHDHDGHHGDDVVPCPHRFTRGGP